MSEWTATDEQLNMFDWLGRGIVGNCTDPREEFRVWLDGVYGTTSDRSSRIGWCRQHDDGLTPGEPNPNKFLATTAVIDADKMLAFIRANKDAEDHSYFGINRLDPTKRYGKNSRGLGKDVIAVRNLLLDVDVVFPGRPSHHRVRTRDGQVIPTPTAEQGVEFLKFVNGFLPLSMVVYTGGGWQGYIKLSFVADPNSNPLHRDLIERYKALCDQYGIDHGVDIDGTCLADAARVFRPPLSRNFKSRPAHQVRIEFHDPDAAGVTEEQLDAVLPPLPSKGTTRPRTVRRRAAKARSGQSGGVTGVRAVAAGYRADYDRLPARLYRPLNVSPIEPWLELLGMDEISSSRREWCRRGSATGNRSIQIETGDTGQWIAVWSKVLHGDWGLIGLQATSQSSVNLLLADLICVGFLAGNHQAMETLWFATGSDPDELRDWIREHR